MKQQKDNCLRHLWSEFDEAMSYERHLIVKIIYIMRNVSVDNKAVGDQNWEELGQGNHGGPCRHLLAHLFNQSLDVKQLLSSNFLPSWPLVWKTTFSVFKSFVRGICYGFFLRNEQRALTLNIEQHSFNHIDITDVQTVVNLS